MAELSNDIGAPDPLVRFVARVLLLLPPCFLVWYIAAPLLVWPLAVAADWVLPLWVPGLVVAVEQAGSALDVMTHLPLSAELATQRPLGDSGGLVFVVDPLIYTYGLPLYTALVHAAPGDEGGNWRRWIWGLPWLLCAQLWGVVFHIAKMLFFELDATIGFAQSAWWLEAIVLGYQLGYLILPSMLPIVIWCVFYRDQLAELVGLEGRSA